MKNLVPFLALSVAASPVSWAQCSYQTVAGSAVTFSGNGVPVAQSVFNNPSSIVAAGDGSIYIADTRNNRVRRISPSGIINTVAGTGEPGFSGDNGPAAQAFLNQPAGLALGADGTLYIADTSNNRVRAVRTDGSIVTVAGQGQATFAGDGGPAIMASLNLPTGLAVDATGRLLIVDSWNNRVRRVERDGTIMTVAGSQGRDDYNYAVPCCQAAPETAPGPSVPLYSPTAVRVGADGEVYISDTLALRVLDTTGSLSTYVFYNQGYSPQVTSSTPVANLQIFSAIPIPVTDGSLVLLTPTQVLDVVNGVASPLNVALLGFYDGASDPSTGGIVVLASAPNASPIIQRVTTGGAASTVYAYAPPTDPSKVQSPLNLDLNFPGAIAIGPDHTIYIGDTNSTTILALSPSGQIANFATLPSVPKSMAVDSKGNLWTASGLSIYETVPGSAPKSVHNAPGTVLSIRFDAQDNLYVFNSSLNQPLIRFGTNGAETTILGNLSPGMPSWFDLSGEFPEPMAVAPDGTVYLSFEITFSNNFSQIMQVTPATGAYKLVPMERRIFPAALAFSASGSLYMTTGTGLIYQLLPDGTIVTLYGGDQYGFWGEHGYDSAPQGNYYSGTRDLAVDGEGLFTVDSGSGSVKRIALDSCAPAPTPAINAVIESATSNTNLYLAAGQLFTIYGLRLGPTTGIVTQFDATGHLPNLVAGMQVTVNGIPAPLLYVSAGQINAIVPFELAGQEPARIAVTGNGATSDVSLGTIGNYGPGIFNYAVGTVGTPEYYAAMLNADGTVNSATNPAKSGTNVTIFATGTGATNPAGSDGAQSGLPLKRPVWPVTVVVANQKITPLYAGTAPTEVEGVTQINLTLPDLSGVGGSAASIGIEMGTGIPPNSRLFYFTQ